MAHILMGTWEQIKAHEAEFIGRQMKVVLDEPNTNKNSNDTPARLAAFDEWVTASRPQDRVVLSDSRTFIYGEDKDRG